MPDLELLVAGAMLVALIFYALLGGADFGGGIWDLLSFGPRAPRQREIIAKAIGPIWEANHVWLILVIVILFTAFPPAYAVILTALFIPMTLFLIGIVLRGAAFVFRGYGGSSDESQRRWGRIFASASFFTPLLLGIVIGAISSGRIELEDDVVSGGWVDSWFHLFPFLVGGFAVALFAFLAAVYLTLELAGQPDLQEDFRKRALAAALAVGVFAFGVLLLADDEAEHIWNRLADSWWTWPLQVATGLAAVGAIWAVWTRRYAIARVCAVAQVTLILAGWGIAMRPYLVVRSVRIDEAAAPDITLQLLLGGLVVGSLLLFPSLFYLYRVFKGSEAFELIDRRR